MSDCAGIAGFGYVAMRFNGCLISLEAGVGEQEAADAVGALEAELGFGMAGSVKAATRAITIAMVKIFFICFPPTSWVFFKFFFLSVVLCRFPFRTCSPLVISPDV